MNIVTYQHKTSGMFTNGEQVSTLLDALRETPFDFEPNTASELRECILEILMQQGWSQTVNIAVNTRISITSMRGRTGLCLQTGNMARFYADFLKLQYLHHNDQIRDAVYFVLSKDSAIKMGSNLANFERVVQELALFGDIITVPMVVAGLSV